ncbi:N-acetylneuraminate synthase [Devosia sp. BSSL-BM10]|uniref:N-acetylneuraminate synthase n=1 Tax=Devosia litorisediminis TaxID=2829817 RepID=A0A942I631_9HYPH|nr:N-acetylneuraminate synthase [Devosia litorisediminis]MBS3849801.1 N-acetylneuraminate synthase [Devosia litorisediminis]
MSTFIIAEAGVNHNGDAALARRLVEVAAESGADAVKFQTFSADKLTAKGAAKAEYQKRATGDGDQYDMLKALEMSETLHKELAALSSELGIEFMSTAFDEESLDLLVALGIRRIKVPSGEVTNHHFLRYMARKNLPLIVSTGMADLAEVEEAIAVIAAEREARGLSGALEDMVSVLHCTSNYPAAVEDVNLNAMLTMGKATGMPVGYSDHTLGIAVSTAAVAMGACVIEKHFTLDKNMPGPDHAASLDPEELKAMVDAIRAVEGALGDGVKAPTASEVPVRALVRRSVTTVRPVAAGIVIEPSDLTLMRPGTGIPPKDFQSVVGRKAAHDIAAGKTLDWADLQ